MADQIVTMERLRRIDYERREFLEVTNTEYAAAWVRSLGHEAASVEADGLRIRTVYQDGGFGCWYWVELGQWIVHMVGDRQQPEFDMPSNDGPERLYHWEGEWVRCSPDSEKGA